MFGKKHKKNLVGPGFGVLGCSIYNCFQLERVKKIKCANVGLCVRLSTNEVTAFDWEQLGVILRCIKDYRTIETLLKHVICDNIKGKRMRIS